MANRKDACLWWTLGHLKRTVFFVFVMEHVDEGNCHVITPCYACDLSFCWNAKGTCSSVKAENFKQRRVKSSAHQSLCDLKYTHTYSKLKYLSVQALMKVCVGSVTFNLNYQLLDIQVYSKNGCIGKSLLLIVLGFSPQFCDSVCNWWKICIFKCVLNIRICESRYSEFLQI